MSIEITAAPLEAAIEKLGARAPIQSILRTEDWAAVPRALRERALFSAGVDNARFLQGVRAKLLAAVRMARESIPASDRATGGQAFVDRSSFIADLRRIAREEGLGTGAGDITDVTSRARLGLIYDIQAQQAQNYARWKSDQDSDVLDAFPAQELVRLEARRAERNWAARWNAANGPRFPAAGNRMVALKTDPVWEGISRFGTPWPPFDFGSGMGLRDLSRADAVALGIIDRTSRLEPATARFNADLQAEATNIDPDFRDALKSAFGSQIDVNSETIAWKGAVA